MLMTLSICSTPIDSLVPAGHRSSPIELKVQCLGENLLNQRRLPAAGHAGDRSEDPERKPGLDRLEVVLGGSLDLDESAVRFAAGVGNGDLSPSCQVVGGDGFLDCQDVGEGALGHDMPAVLACSRPDVDHMVGDSDGVLVVFHHDEGVAEIAQPQQRLDEALVVTLMETDGGLVEDVQHPDQTGADLGGETDALGLSPGQSGSRSGQS